MNGRILALALLPLLCTICSASKLNWGWLVPGGGLQLDRASLTSSKFCALTFDDGPDWQYTPEVGRILDRAGIDGTFFVLGKNAKQQPDVLATLVAGGHEIASHSWSHPDFTTAGSAKVARELRDTNELLAGCGITPRWFRPPYGAYNRATVRAAADCGLQTILWSVDPRDWATPGVEVIVNRVLEGVHPGAVILLHSTNPQTVAALPWIVEGLQKKGYAMVTLTEWARLISGGTPLPALDEVPLAPAKPAPLELPAAPAPPDGAPAALRVISNFTGPHELDAVLRAGTTSNLYRFAYAASRPAPMIEETLTAEAGTAAVAGSAISAAIDTPAAPETPAAAADVPSPEPLPASAETADAAPAVAAEPPSDGAGAWHAPSAIDPALLAAPPDFSQPTSFLMVKAGGGAWSGSASINRLLEAGRFAGVLVAAEHNLTGSISNLAAPTLLQPLAGIDPTRIVDLSRKDTSAILELCAAGIPAVCITFDPTQLTLYRGSGDPASIAYLAEFLLLRAATAGMLPAPGPGLPGIALPEGVAGATYAGGGALATALRGSGPPVTIALPVADAPLYLTRLRDDGTYETTAAGDSLTLGDELVIVSTFAVAER